MTNMDILLTLLGSMMLVWAHIMFLVDLAGTLENLRTRQIVVERGAAADAALNGDAPEDGRDGTDAAMEPVDKAK